MTAKSQSEKEARGCAFLIAVACVATGIGYIFGAGYGWLAFGAIVLLLWAIA